MFLSRIIKLLKQHLFSQTTRWNSRCKLLSSIALFDWIARERKFLLKSSTRDPSWVTKTSECPSLCRIVVSRILRKSSQRNILYPRVAPEILTISLERFHNWTNTKKEALSSRFLSSFMASFSSGINLSSLYSSCCILFFPHPHFATQRHSFQVAISPTEIFLFPETLNPRIKCILMCVDILHQVLKSNSFWLGVVYKWKIY